MDALFSHSVAKKYRNLSFHVFIYSKDFAFNTSMRPKVIGVSYGKLPLNYLFSTFFNPINH